jgi:hypothetical protein
MSDGTGGSVRMESGGAMLPDDAQPESKAKDKAKIDLRITCIAFTLLSTEVACQRSST